MCTRQVVIICPTHINYTTPCQQTITSIYRIAGNFREGKLSRIGRKGAFHGENFCRMLNNGCGMPLEKISAGGCEIAKFVKVFSLKSLYGLLTTVIEYYILGNIQYAA